MPDPSGLPGEIQTEARLDQQSASPEDWREREREKPQSPTYAALHLTPTGWQQRATPLWQGQTGRPPQGANWIRCGGWGRGWDPGRQGPQW